MKILIIHASAGAGHTKAAEAVARALKKTGHSIRLADALDHTSGLYKRIYRNTYSLLITKMPRRWGVCYDVTAGPCGVCWSRSNSITSFPLIFSPTKWPVI